MTDEKKIQWKDTLNLPKTDFPMKAQLNSREPLLLNKWKDIDIYNKILDKRKNKPEYILHDGPPYANGNIHLGTAMNKIIKDFIVKTKSMEGFYAPYVPGWDCHGLPIEIKVDKELGPKKKDMSTIEIREKCRHYAEKYVDIQREEFKRLGVFGNWEDPYTTLKPSYESTIINYFKSYVKNKNVYRRKRPVYWCISCKTALAEAEVEYMNHTSPSIYVKFLLKDVPDFLEKFKTKDIYVLIWTTTPWTIPANLAIALHPDYDYSLFEMNNEYFIAATRLIPLIADLIKAEYKILTDFKGEKLKGFNTIHPLYDRNSVLINADYVVLDQGTGCVHTAPGHGEEDYWSGIEYNIDIYSPVDSSGCFDSTTGKYEGKQVFESNSEVVDDLRDRERLIFDESIDHSYPHCWRCKNPVIFRATEQWFISMDTADLREKALQKIKEVTWLPNWGEERIFSMIEKRPDWCISRQRDWGVPIPVFYCKKCEEPHLSVESTEKVEEMFRKHGSNSWYTNDIKDFIPESTRCEKCGSQDFRKGLDIIDVWFESGSSFGILEQYPGHRFPSDLYIEGNDQYRGWFHSSLLVGVRAKEKPPFKTVISHGFVLDQEGRALSKSLGNVIKPQSIITEKGAEILRLWVAMVNYKEDMKLGEELLLRITESYRKIRNTWRFMLGVISDFDPDTESVEDSKLREVDLFMLNRLQHVKSKILQAYKDFEYHIVYHAISNFFTNDLSSFYLHFMKDNLYCNEKKSNIRKSAQTVIFKLLKETLLLAAPILSFTAEEAWEHLPQFKEKEESIHLHLFPEVENNYFNTVDEKKWEQILALRDNVLKEIEEARGTQKTIGDSLEAEINLHLKDDLYSTVENNLELIKELLVVSKINMNKSEDEKITVKKSEGEKCPRCWNWFFEDTSSELCPRCSRVVTELKIDPAQ